MCTRYYMIVFIIAFKFANISNSQEIVTLPPKAHSDDHSQTPYGVDVDNIDLQLNVIDDEIKSVPLPVHEMQLSTDQKEVEQHHHKPDHRFRLISLDNLVHLNPALQVSLWIFIGSIIKVGKLFNNLFHSLASKLFNILLNSLYCDDFNLRKFRFSI